MLNAPARHVRAALPLSLLLAALPTRAVPLGRIDTFDKAPLDERVWRLAYGDPANVQVSEGKLRLSPPPLQAIRLARRFYPLRSEGERPEFGDFRVSIKLGAPARDGIQLDLRPPILPGGLTPWSVALRLFKGKAWLRFITNRVGQMHGRDESEMAALQFEPDTLEWVRQGSILEARLRAGAKTQVVGRYEGQIPPVLDFWITATRPQDAAPNAPSIDIDELRIEPLPKSAAFSQVLARPGTPLSGDSYKLGGFLWAPSDKPALQIRVASLQKTGARLTLKTSVVDTNGRVVWKREVPVSLPARGEKTIPVALPSARFGSFVFLRQLVDARGSPLEARQSTRFGITRAPLPGALGDSSFGIHGGAFARIGAKWQRYWDIGGPFWNNTEPAPGKWSWAHSDKFVARTLAAQMKPLFVLCGPPKWAASKPERGTYLGDGALSPPKDLKQWSNYVRAVATRYRGRVTHYELWNEPNSNGLDPEGFFFQGTVEQYFEMLRATHTALKSADPNAKLLAPSGTGHFFPWLGRLVELGGMKYFDILSIHTYTTPFPPEIGYQFNQEKSYAHRVQRAREIMRAGGGVKPIWNTEIGFQGRATRSGLSLTRDEIASEALPDSWPNWSRGWSFRPPDVRSVDAFVPRFFMGSLALGVEKTFLHHSLMEDDAGSPLEEAPAYGAASWLLSKVKFDREYAVGKGSRAMGFARPDGKYLLAFWRVEDESLTMDREREKGVGAVGSAPMADVDQGAIASVLPPPRATYFPAQRIVARSIKLSFPLRGALPLAFDVWGNAVKFASVMPVEEAPRYVLFWSKPPGLGLQVLEGVAQAAPRAAGDSGDALASGRLVASQTSVVHEVGNLEEMLPNARKLSLSLARAMENAGTEPSKIVGEGEAQLGGIRWALPKDVPARARIALSVRAGDKANADFNFAYEMRLNGRAVELAPWAAWPIQLQFEGEGYAMTQGVVLSAPVAMKAGDRLEVVSRRDHGRVFGAWFVAP